MKPRPKRGPRMMGLIPGFALDIPPETGNDAPVPVKRGHMQEEGDVLFVAMDANMESPIVTQEAGGPPPFPVAPPGAPLTQPRAQRQFLRIDQSSVYVVVESHHSGSPTSGAPSTPHLVRNEQVVRTGPPLDQIEFLEHLGSGQQGSVRSCRDRATGQVYAMKRISVGKALEKGLSDTERQARKKSIMRELQLLQRQHQSDHIVKMYNAYFATNGGSQDDMRKEKEAELLILMERMQCTLEDIQLEAGRLTNLEVRRITQECFDRYTKVGTPLGRREVYFNEARREKDRVQRTTALPEIFIGTLCYHALLGLRDLHNLNIVHTDVKPSNLLIDCNGVLKLGDFGCSHVAEETGVVPPTALNLGAKLYMSPERVRLCYSDAELSSLGITVAHDEDEEARPVGFTSKSDIWSLGISMMEMVSGCHPCQCFREEYWNFAEHLDSGNHLVMPVGCSAAFFNFLERCLDPNPNRRASAEDLLQHEFIERYKAVPSHCITRWITTVQKAAATQKTTQVKQQIREQVMAGVKTLGKKQNYAHRNAKTWRGFTGEWGAKVPSFRDEQDFPKL